MAGMNVRDDALNQIPKPKPSGRDLAYRAVAAVFGGPVDLTEKEVKVLRGLLPFRGKDQ